MRSDINNFVILEEKLRRDRPVGERLNQQILLNVISFPLFRNMS